MQINLTKIILYVVLGVLAIHCARQFVLRYSHLMASDVDADPIAMIDSGKKVPATTAGTNAVVTATNETAVANSPTNDASAAVTNAVSPVETNAPATNAAPPVETQALTKRGMDRPDAPDASGIGFYAFGMFGTLIGLGFLIAHDVSSFMGQKAHKFVHNEEGEGIHSVAYDKAEDVWANGDYLEAIRLMREYLNKNPREVHVMARIAEIYEKDLNNHLAAALEYEEFLKQKLPPERWAWAAIHLVNLYYGKLDKPDQGLALLWRIHREYGNTQAAGKARKRLNQIDPDFAVEQARLDREAAEAAAADRDFDEEPEDEGTTADGYSAPAAPAWEPPADDDSSNLPKGFRPKKR
ncbi:hypothetical protein GC207_14795 [bacterium]|nr:hypothetical protein [bacterium]